MAVRDISKMLGHTSRVNISIQNNEKKKLYKRVSGMSDSSV
jgi:hypothetical protein